MKPNLIRWTAVGAGVGAGYGAALRAWMRLITQEPEFSWSGTGYIVGVFTVLGVFAGLVSAGRARGWGPLLTGTRIVAVTLSLGCFLAAGMAMFPTVVPAALGLARSSWPRVVRAGLVLFGAGAALVVVLTLSGLSPTRRLVALVCYALLCSVEVALMARLFAPNAPDRRATQTSRSTAGQAARAA